MAVRKILLMGDEGLRKVARPVEAFDKRLHTLLADMAETMYEADGAGLAAPQVGILRRAIVIDSGDGNGVIELVNPEIIAFEGEQINPEGCLSIPGRRCTVMRPQKLTVRAQDRFGEVFELSCEDFCAVAVCHEIDHLQGVLYVDRMIEDVTEQYQSQEPDEKE